MNYHVLDTTGHTTHKWDSDSLDDVEAARALFTTLTGKGHRAFTVGANGKAGTRVDTFDPEIEELTFVPQLRGG